jgi:uncharacterized protein (DUF4415 family)
LAFEDQRKDYGEARMIGYGYLRLYCEAYTDRGEERRIISLRKAKAGRFIAMPALKPGTHIPDADEDARIQQGIDQDPDTYELSNQEFAKLCPVGRPPLENPKVPVSIRLSPEVVEHFRKSGRGWQARIDHILKQHVQDVTR